MNNVNETHYNVCKCICGIVFIIIIIIISYDELIRGDR